MDKQVKRIKRELIRSGAILDIYTDTMQLPGWQSGGVGFYLSPEGSGCGRAGTG